MASLVETAQKMTGFTNDAIRIVRTRVGVGIPNGEVVGKDRCRRGVPLVQEVHARKVAGVCALFSRKPDQSPRVGSPPPPQEDT